MNLSVTDVALAIRSDVLHNCLVGLLVVVCAFELLAECQIFLVVVRCRAIGANVRVLLCNLLLAAVVSAFSYLLVVAYDIYKFAVYLNGGSSDPTVLLYNLMQCQLLNLPKSLGSIGNLSALVFLALERVYATCAYRTYEQSNSYRISLLVCSIQWLVAISMILSVRAYVFISGEAAALANDTVPHCASFALKNRKQGKQIVSVIRILFGVPPRMGATLFFVLIWLLNDYKRRHKLDSFQSLAQRFQIKENITMSLMLAKIATAKLLWDFVVEMWVTLCYRWALTDRSRPPLPTYIAEFTMIGVLICSGTAVQALLIAKSNDVIVRRCPRWLTRLLCVRQLSLPVGIVDLDVGGTELQEAHFKRLEEQWRRQLKQQRFRIADSVKNEHQSRVHHTAVHNDRRPSQPSHSQQYAVPSTSAATGDMRLTGSLFMKRQRSAVTDSQKHVSRDGITVVDVHCVDDVDETSL